jgi:replicative DNA helicase
LTQTKQQRKSSINKQPQNILSPEGKLLPQAIDIEEAVLGSIMIDPDCVYEAMELINRTTFYKDANGIIFDACRNLYDKGNPIDILTVSEQLRANGELELVGGNYYISMLTNRVSSGKNISSHCHILIEKQIKRTLAEKSNSTATMAFDDTIDAFDCLKEYESAVIEVNEIFSSGSKMMPISVVLDETKKVIEKRESQYKSGKCVGIPTGLFLLNKLTGGWQNSDLIILAGRPSMGKTALMLHHAIKAGVNVNIYSPEMSKEQLGIRLIITKSGIDASKLKTGALNSVDWEAYKQAEQEYKLQNKIFIDDNPIITTRQIKAKSKIMQDKGKCDMIMVDYLQLLDMRSDQNNRNREQEVSQAIRELKIIAKTLNIPVIVLSQLSRLCEQRADKRPLLSDLRESGSIEQDADVVIFAYRPSYYKLKNRRGEDVKTDVGYEIVAKGRNVGIGDIPFKYNESMTQIYDYELEQKEIYQPIRNYSEQEKQEDPF